MSVFLITTYLFNKCPVLVLTPPSTVRRLQAGPYTPLAAHRAGTAFGKAHFAAAAFSLAHGSVRRGRTPLGAWT